MIRCLFIFAACLVACSAGHNVTEEGEFGKHNESRTIMCDKKYEELRKDMETCFRMEPKIIQDATAECITDIRKGSSGDTIEFVRAACEDRSLFKKLDECLKEYEANASYKKQMEVTPEVAACYEEAYQRHNATELMDEFNES